MLRSKKFLIAFALLGFTHTATASECSAKSGVATVPLLELYTSEGCSSCPPADKWMRSIQSNKVTPLAFHVDYWNDIGWKDKFSKAEHSERQRKLATFGGAGFVYTPQFVMNGRDFRSWDNARLNAIVEKNQKLASRANLSLNVATLENGAMLLNVGAQAINLKEATNADVFVAIYENKLVTQVKAGENNGSTLKHDYVVREFFGAYQMRSQNAFSKDFNLHADWNKKDAGAVIFVQNSQTGEILQSLALSFRQC